MSNVSSTKALTVKSQPFFPNKKGNNQGKKKKKSGGQPRVGANGSFVNQNYGQMGPNQKFTGMTEKQFIARLNRMRPMLSPCARMYCSAVTNPFKDFDEMPCIPDMMSAPSFKFKSVCRSIMGIGAGGIGFILVNPFAMATSGKALVEPPTLGISAISPAVINTNTSFPTGFDIIAPVDDGSSGPAPGMAGTDYPANDSTFTHFTTGQKVRLVGCGVQMMFSGEQLHLGGRFTLYTEPNNDCIGTGAVNGSVTYPHGVYQTFSGTGHGTGIPISVLLATRNANWGVATRAARSVCYRPAFEDLQYKQWIWNTSDFANYPMHDTYAATNDIPRYSLGIFVDGATPGITFGFEVHAFFEVIGRNVPNLTASHTDPQGLSAVQGVIAMRPKTNESPAVVEKQTAASATQALTQMSGGLGDVIKTVKAVGEVGKTVMSILG